MDGLAPSDVIMRVEHLSRAVDSRCVVDDISFELRRGEVLAIIGPSGAGKSSLLRLLNRLDEPSEGAIYLNGQDYRSIPPRELRRQVGMVLQSPYLFPGSVADNIRFGPRQRGQSLPDRAVEHLLEQVGLPGYAEHDVACLSGGEAQRVSLARTLANNPQVLLLDEPTSALDAVAERTVERVIAAILAERASPCLIVTHDHAQAARIADRAMLLAGGRLVKIGRVQEVLDAQTDIY